MITIYETERLFQLIRNKNNKKYLENFNGFSFNNDIGIINCNKKEEYSGKRETIDIFARLLYKYEKKQAFEVHLQAYILQKLNNNEINFLYSILQKEYVDNYDIEWIGNEVSCGVGMQRIDIMISLISKCDNTNRIIIPIELKDEEIDEKIINQLYRYINWIKQYYIPNRISNIKPIIIGKFIKNNAKLNTLLESLKEFNSKTDNDCCDITYINFKITDKIIFDKVEY